MKRIKYKDFDSDYELSEWVAVQNKNMLRVEVINIESFLDVDIGNFRIWYYEL